MACTIIHLHHDRQIRWDPPIKSPACISWSIRDGPLPFQTWPVGRGLVIQLAVQAQFAPDLCSAVLRPSYTGRPLCKTVCEPVAIRLMFPQHLSVATKAASAPCRKNAITSVECQANGLSTSGCGVKSCHFPTVMR